MVLVCHRHRFVFMKTHKTASTSVEMYFERHCVPPGRHAGTEAVTETVSELGVVGSRRSGKRKTDTWFNHMPASRVRALLGADMWDRYFKFATVRNPYAMMVSHYFWHTRQPYPGDDAALDRARDGFGRFVRGRWLFGRKWDNDLAIVGIDGRYAMDGLIRIERLAADLQATCARLGLPWEPEALPHTKKTQGAPRTYPLHEFYTPATARIVASEFAWVLERMDYALDPAPARGDAAPAAPA